MNKKIGAVTLLVLMSLAVALPSIDMVGGQSSLGVTILQVLPVGTTSFTGQSQYNGTAGQVFSLQGTINTSNGSYQLVFGQSVLSTGVASGFYVNGTFTVPNIQSGSYPLILVDVSAKINSTSESFIVLVGYFIHVNPSQTQEGSNVELSVGVTGGTPNAAYAANVTVALPSPLNTTAFSQVVSMGTSNSGGTASAKVTYPSSSFLPSGNTINYVGTYAVYFNESLSLAASQFYVGFLNSTTYHRADTVAITAIGYQSAQAATLSITNSTGASLYSQSVNATADGVINATWPVPSDMVVGNYTVTISPTGTQKAIEDKEVFSVTGYLVQVTMLNLGGQYVPQIELKALDQRKDTIYSGESDSLGVVGLKLERGPYHLTAFWNGVNVGETNITVTDTQTLTMTCKLTDLKIKVQSENQVALSSVNLTITYQYKLTSTGALQTGNASGQTNSAGIYLLNSTLTGISYVVNASLYNRVFNSANNTVNNVPAQAELDVGITCPSVTLTLGAVDYYKAAIPDANIQLVELTNGLFYTSTTDSSGSTTNQVTFGMYKLQIYKNNILINETAVAAFGDSSQQIVCNLYGIPVTVSVVDFFGTPISNANVTLNGPAAERLSAITHSDGTASFSDVVGGNVQIVAFAKGAQSNYQAVALTVDQPTSVQIKMDRYVVFGSAVIPVSSLITLVIILVAAVLFVIVEVYRRRIVKSPV